jgi:hypothetical protein
MPTWAIVLLVIGGVIVLACGGVVALVGLGAKGISDANEAAKNDVTISSCSVDGVTGAKADLDVTNHGKRTASYSITVKFVSDDGATQIGTAVAFVNSPEPGQTAHPEAVSFQGQNSGGGKCAVDSVTKI